MNHIFEVYTESGTANVEELKQEVFYINNGEYGNIGGFEQLARYAVETPGGTNILIELDVPSGFGVDDDKIIFMTAYEYEGSLKDYNCDDGDIDIKEFNLDWENLELEMSNYAKSFTE